MYFFKFTTLFLIFFLKNVYLYGDECQNFIKSVLEIPIPQEGMVTDGQQSKNDIGIFFHTEYDFKKNIIKIKRDINNYPILKFSLTNNIPSDTSITLINNIDLSEKSDKEIEELVDTKKAIIQTKKDTFEVKSIEYDHYPFELVFFEINAIDEIKTKEGEFVIDYVFQAQHERPDWIEAGREITKFYICSLDELLESDRILSPLTSAATYILKQVGYDQDKSFNINEQYYFEPDDKTYTTVSPEGIATIKSDFDLKKFPFDSQTLRITLRAPEDIQLNLSDLISKPYVSTFTPLANTYLYLNKYKNDNYLKEWKIVDIRVSNSLASDDYVSFSDNSKFETVLNDNINIDIEVERNTNYFIFKIIIPVFLILSIAWSVMWIPPNQVESRLTTSIVALLALIAYNFVFNEDIPKLSYLTSLDRYILLSYLFCAIPTFLTIYFSRLTKKDYNIALSVNKKSRLIGLVIYALSTTLIFSA